MLAVERQERQRDRLAAGGQQDPSASSVGRRRRSLTRTLTVLGEASRAVPKIGVDLVLLEQEPRRRR